jgi:cytochrome b561
MPGNTVSLLGGVDIPKIPGISKGFGEAAGEFHELAAVLLCALIVVHIAAALKHQFIDHNRAAGRMPPFQDPIDEPVVVGQGGDAR